MEHLGDAIEEAAAQSVLGDPKNVLQERAFQLGLAAPSYHLVERGPEHAKVFVAEVGFGGSWGAERAGRRKRPSATLPAMRLRATCAADEASPTVPRRSVSTETVPELPEVETVRLGLEELILGHRVTDVEVTGKRTIRRQGIEEFRGELIGATRCAPVAAGSTSSSIWTAPGFWSSISGCLARSGSNRPRSRTRRTPTSASRCRMAAKVRFVDPRTFGELFVTSELDERGVPAALSGLGRDPLTDEIAVSELFSSLVRRHLALKAFLLDQREICGIGNIYADEICFAARLSPLRRTESLKRTEVARLVASIHQVLGRRSPRRDRR